MTTENTNTDDKYKLLELIVLGKDLSNLDGPARVQYYAAVCESVKLNPLTRPFEYITLDGKVVLYAKRECTDQLRAIHDISISIVERSMIDNIYVVTARATKPDGRKDESTGAVSLVNPEKYKDRDNKWQKHPNAGLPIPAAERAVRYMVAETKAKRRVTLSIVGLGLLDESEVADIPSIGVSAEEPVATIQGPTPKKPEEPKIAAPQVQCPPEGSASADVTVGPAAAAAPSKAAATPTPAPKKAPVDSSPAETGELLTEGKKRVLRAKMLACGCTDEHIKKMFGKPLDGILKSDRAEVEAFIANWKT